MPVDIIAILQEPLIVRISNKGCIIQHVEFEGNSQFIGNNNRLWRESIGYLKSLKIKERLRSKLPLNEAGRSERGGRSKMVRP